MHQCKSLLHKICKGQSLQEMELHEKTTYCHHCYCCNCYHHHHHHHHHHYHHPFHHHCCHPHHHHHYHLPPLLLSCTISTSSIDTPAPLAYVAYEIALHSPLPEYLCDLQYCTIEPCLRCPPAHVGEGGREQQESCHLISRLRLRLSQLHRLRPSDAY